MSFALGFRFGGAIGDIPSLFVVGLRRAPHPGRHQEGTRIADRDARPRRITHQIIEGLPTRGDD